MLIYRFDCDVCNTCTFRSRLGDDENNTIDIAELIENSGYLPIPAGYSSVSGLYVCPTCQTDGKYERWKNERKNPKNQSRPGSASNDR